jgi:hypothetical protein
MITYHQGNYDPIRQQTPFDVCVDYQKLDEFVVTRLEWTYYSWRIRIYLDQKAYSLGQPFVEFFENYHLNAIGSD